VTPVYAGNSRSWVSRWRYSGIRPWERGKHLMEPRDR
jgi:hypothetical protein